MASAVHAAPGCTSAVRIERIERVLSIGEVLLFAEAVVAVVRDHARWELVPTLKLTRELDLSEARFRP